MSLSPKANRAKKRAIRESVFSQEDGENLCRQLITIAQVPEVDRAATYLWMEIEARSRTPYSRAAGCFCHLAKTYWTGWPPQVGPIRHRQT